MPCKGNESAVQLSDGQQLLPQQSQWHVCWELAGDWEPVVGTAARAAVGEWADAGQSATLTAAAERSAALSAACKQLCQ